MQRGKSFVVTNPHSNPFTGHVIASETTCPDSAANHKLIAAAPRLLELLEWALCKFEGESGTGDSYWSQFPEYEEAGLLLRHLKGGAS